jgi:hypothetical protein
MALSIYHAMEAKEDISNMYYDSPKLMNHALSAAENTGQAVTHGLEAAKNSKLAIERSRKIWSDILILEKAADNFYSYINQQKDDKPADG